MLVLKVVVRIRDEFGVNGPVLAPVLDGGARPRAKVDACQYEFLLGSRDRDEKSRCSGVTPEELLLDSKHNHFFKLEALALVDRQNPHGVEFGQPLECFNGVSVHGQLSPERVHSAFNDLIKSCALLVCRRQGVEHWARHDVQEFGDDWPPGSEVLARERGAFGPVHARPGALA